MNIDEFLHIVTELPVRFDASVSSREGDLSSTKTTGKPFKKRITSGVYFVLNESPLIGNDKGVVVGIFIVNKIDDRGTLLSANKILQGYRFADSP